MLYTAYVKANKRKLICEMEITLDRAIDFLKETKYGLIIDDENLELTLEELENVKNIRSLPGIGEGDFSISGGEVPEDTHRELLKSLRNYSESSTERDNQWDEQS